MPMTREEKLEQFSEDGVLKVRRIIPQKALFLSVCRGGANGRVILRAKTDATDDEILNAMDTPKPTTTDDADSHDITQKGGLINEPSLFSDSSGMKYVDDLLNKDLKSKPGSDSKAKVGLWKRIKRLVSGDAQNAQNVSKREYDALLLFKTETNDAVKKVGRVLRSSLLGDLQEALLAVDRVITAAKPEEKEIDEMNKDEVKAMIDDAFGELSEKIDGLLESKAKNEGVDSAQKKDGLPDNQWKGEGWESGSGKDAIAMMTKAVNSMNDALNIVKSTIKENKEALNIINQKFATFENSIVGSRQKSSQDSDPLDDFGGDILSFS